MTTWCPPARMPSRAELVPMTTPTPRKRYDDHIDAIVAAILDRARDRALDAHHVARALLTPDRQ